MVQPELFTIGPLTVYSYGLMLGIAFIIASILLTKEFERKGLGSTIATEITLISIVFGIIGSKLFHLFNYWEAFLNDPIGMAFSPSGLTFHGGLILALLISYIYLRRKGIPFLYAADGAVPSLAIAYGIGRIGCHLSGDGDYGCPTNLPWAVDYSNGVVPPSAALADTHWAADFPNGIIPDGILCHPTPIYEFLSMLILFSLLWWLRKKDWIHGKLFMVFLVYFGASRFLVEFIRLNPRLGLGLTEAQWVAGAEILIGTGFLIYYAMNPTKERYHPPKELSEKKDDKSSDKKKNL